MNRSEYLSPHLGLLLILSTLALPTAAQTPDEKLRKIYADPPVRSAAAAAGKSAAFFCANCHGEDGNSKMSEVPNLAGQNASYLLEQIRKFSSGQRRDEFMQGLMKVLSADDRVNIAVYYATMNVTATGSGAQSARGRDLYFKLCTRCHGEQGRGTETIPRLAGQQQDYLVKSLTRYRNRSGERMDPQMAANTALLKDEDLRGLAAYLSGMR